MELETDAFQIIIEEESNRTGKKNFSVTTHSVYQQWLIEKKPSEFSMIDKQAIIDNMR